MAWHAYSDVHHIQNGCIVADFCGQRVENLVKLIYSMETVALDRTIVKGDLLIHYNACPHMATVPLDII